MVSRESSMESSASFGEALQGPSSCVVPVRARRGVQQTRQALLGEATFGAALEAAGAVGDGSVGVALADAVATGVSAAAAAGVGAAAVVLAAENGAAEGALVSAATAVEVLGPTEAAAGAEVSLAVWVVSVEVEGGGWEELAAVVSPPRAGWVGHEVAFTVRTCCEGAAFRAAEEARGGVGEGPVAGGASLGGSLGGVPAHTDHARDHERGRPLGDEDILTAR